ncbi:MAG: hypothetical protein J4F46_05975 [Dehalococcoidia bacterium]|nr:hypothetical protein [Dehalococcoidia bacterium]
MSGKIIKILDPTAHPMVGDVGLAPRVVSLGNNTLGVVSNAWRSYDVMANHFEEIAKDKYEIREVMRTVNLDLSGPLIEDRLNALVEKADAAIVGMGH